MRLSHTIVTISLALIIAIAFAAAVQKQNSLNPNRFTFDRKTDNPFVNAITLNLLTTASYLPQNFFTPVPQYTDIPETLAAPQWNATRTEIYDFIAANPGVNFRGICSSLGLSIGLAQFHLGVLTKAGLVSYLRDGKYKRFFTAKRFSKKQMKIIAVLRHPTEGSILKALMEKKQVSHGQLTHELSITSQGLTWHMNRLGKNHLITERKDGKKLLYSLDQASETMLKEMSNLTQRL